MFATLFTTTLAHPVNFMSEAAMVMFLPAIAGLMVALIAADRTA